MIRIQIREKHRLLPICLRTHSMLFNCEHFLSSCRNFQLYYMSCQLWRLCSRYIFLPANGPEKARNYFDFSCRKEQNDRIHKFIFPTWVQTRFGLQQYTLNLYADLSCNDGSKVKILKAQKKINFSDKRIFCIRINILWQKRRQNAILHETVIS